MATLLDQLTDPAQKNAAEALFTMLDQYGLGTLANQVVNFIKSGFDGQTTDYLVRQTPEWKQRFAGNDLRVKAGLPPLQPAEYLATESAYKQVLGAYGVPKGQFDSPDMLAKFIGNDLSPSEFHDRVAAAYDKVLNVDQFTRDSFQQFYGVDASHMLSYVLDPTIGSQVIQRQAAAAQIGGAAAAQGLTVSRDRAEQYAGQGVDFNQAQRAYGTIAGILPQESALARRYGQSYSQSDAEDELLGGLASARRKREQLNQQESASFAGQGGVGSTLYHPDYGLATQTTGQF